MRKRAAKQQELKKAPGASHKPVVREAKVEPANMLTEAEELKPFFLGECCNLTEVFSERESDVLPPHQPMDCTIEIILGA